MNPNEIFTYPLHNRAEITRQIDHNYHCRFLGRPCDKQSRLVPYPMGICSANHTIAKAIICPHRFLESKTVFTDICHTMFGDTNNVLLFSEVRLENVGSFDFVLVKHHPISNKMADFCIVELQSDSTTGTGGLVEAMQDFMANKDITEQRYKFGLNTYNTIKLSYTQMLIKGQVMEKWGKQIFWVMQKYVFDNMVERFRLNSMDYNPQTSTQYILYDLFPQPDIFELKLVDKKSSTIANLLKAFTHQPAPNLDKFILVHDKTCRTGILPVQIRQARCLSYGFCRVLSKFIEVLESKIKLQLGISVG